MVSIYLRLSGSVHLERKYIVCAFIEGALRESSLYYNSFSFLRPIFITIVNIIASELFSTLKKEIDELKGQNEILKNRQTSVNHQSVVSKKKNI